MPNYTETIRKGGLCLFFGLFLDKVDNIFFWFENEASNGAVLNGDEDCTLWHGGNDASGGWSASLWLMGI